MPFPLTASPTRTQQVVGSGQFANGAFSIIALRLRASPGSGAVNFSFNSFQITVSTTQVFPNTSGGRALPSATYAAKVGPDALVVYNGPFSAASPGCAAPGPCAFDITIPFSTPFPYDPSKGRLLVDVVSSSTGSVSGSLDGVVFSDPTASNEAIVSGDATKTAGTVATAGLVLGLEPGTQCAPKSSIYPCSIAGTLLVTSAPTGGLFGGGGGGGGGGGNGNVVTFINDAQNPGFSFASGTNPLIESNGPVQTTITGTLNLATVSGQATLNGGRASVTCGVTGNATASLTINSPGGTTTLTCPKVSTTGVALTVFGQASFSPLSSLSETVTISVNAPAATDSVTLTAYSLQATLISVGPSVITDNAGVINGGSYAAGQIVSGSWVAVKGSGFTDPGVTVDWSNLDFSKGLPTILNGVQVLFNGVPGAMWYLIDGAPQQINVQAPANLSGNVAIQVVRDNHASNIVSTTAVNSAPGIFSYSLDGGRTFFPSAVFADRTPLGDPTIYPGARKAKAGDIVVMFANSLAPSPAGVVSVSASTDPVTITIGTNSFSADVSALVAPGEFQINFTVPKLPASGNLPITIQIDGKASQGSVLFPYSN